MRQALSHHAQALARQHWLAVAVLLLPLSGGCEGSHGNSDTAAQRNTAMYNPLPQYVEADIVLVLSELLRQQGLSGWTPTEVSSAAGLALFVVRPQALCPQCLNEIAEYQTMIRRLPDVACLFAMIDADEKTVRHFMAASGITMPALLVRDSKLSAQLMSYEAGRSLDQLALYDGATQKIVLRVPILNYLTALEHKEVVLSRFVEYLGSRTSGQPGKSHR
jgi:hypothetical protein